MLLLKCRHSNHSVPLFSPQSLCPSPVSWAVISVPRPHSPSPVGWHPPTLYPSHQAPPLSHVVCPLCYEASPTVNNKKQALFYIAIHACSQSSGQQYVNIYFSDVILLIATHSALVQLVSHLSHLLGMLPIPC